MFTSSHQSTKFLITPRIYSTKIKNLLIDNDLIINPIEELFVGKIVDTFYLWQFANQNAFIYTISEIISGLRLCSCLTMVNMSTSSSCCSCCMALYTAQNTSHPVAPSLVKCLIKYWNMLTLALSLKKYYFCNVLRNLFVATWNNENGILIPKYV